MTGTTLFIVLTTKTTETTTSVTSTTETTTTTVTTTSVTTTTTTPQPPCPPSSSGLLYANGSMNDSYTCYAYAWQAPTTKTVSLTFQMRNDPDYWYLDDVSVLEGTTQMISNGGFETGSSSPWMISPTRGCGIGNRATVMSVNPHSGFYAVVDGCIGAMNSVSQSFSVVAGQIYVVSFWLQSNYTGSGVIANVTLF